jgi:hypothetical protein
MFWFLPGRLEEADHADPDDDEDWATVLEVFRAARSRRGDKGRDDKGRDDKGRDDRKFLEAIPYFSVHNITWRDHLAGAAGHLRQVEQRLETLLAPEPGGRVRGLLWSTRCLEPYGSPCANVQLHRCARPRLGRRRERGQHHQALGRSRGGFSTKIHLKVDLDGLPLAFHLTEGEASDSPQFAILLDLGPDITPRAAVGDKGYNSKADRSAARTEHLPRDSLHVIGQEPADILPESTLPSSCPHRAARW